MAVVENVKSLSFPKKLRLESFFTTAVVKNVNSSNFARKWEANMGY